MAAPLSPSPPRPPPPPMFAPRTIALLLLISFAPPPCFLSASSAKVAVPPSSSDPANATPRRCAATAAAAAAVVASSSSSANLRQQRGPPADFRSLFLFRGGDDDGGGGGGIAKKKKKKKSRGGGAVGAEGKGDGDGVERKTRRRKRGEERGEVDDDDEKREGRRAIDVAMKETATDAASALGDAIRDRGDVLRSDKLDRPTSSTVGRIDASLSSLGWSLGTSDSSRSRDYDEPDEEEEEGGGVSASPGAVVANYFLRSHGGLHGVQSIASALSVLFGIGAILVPSSSSSDLKLTLIRRCLQCALAKHASGLFAIASVSARGVRTYGFAEARRKLERSARDPVAQYSFYCALLLVWTAGGVGGGKTTSAAAAAAVATGGGSTEATKGEETSSPAASATGAGVVAAAASPWWLSAGTNGDGTLTRFLGKLAVPAVLGPILLREIASTAWAISDVSVLLATSSSRTRDPMVLRVARSTVDAFLSLLFTPSEWRGSDAAQRQRLLAKLVSKSSLFFELIVAMILLYDATRAFLDYALSPVAKRPGLGSTAKRVMVARLYLNFMLARRRKVVDLVGTVRGGASAVPGRVLDALLEPRKAMGLLDADGDNDIDNGDGRRALVEGNRGGNRRGKWLEVVFVVLGFDE